MEKTYKWFRTYLAWRDPGDPNRSGRVELIPPSKINEPDSISGRTAETVTIPAGCVIDYKIEEQDPS